MAEMTATATRFRREEPIPGYFTRTMIGRGGYGEVWHAEAPGGLPKAIKIVYGGVDQKLAARELRSLSRLRSVRHPFLLSLERVEVVEGNLVIVMELADRSLADAFRRRREAGHPGIPEDELLGYLRDAADALDFIYGQYALQHLDIKPENLLLLGDHVKIADFGLLKNIYERGASIVDGLTPTYSPPELFSGRPSKNSDQYSLAIVYQQLLTGTLPFDGTTTAQLALQHLKEAPNLSALPREQSTIVARALSKDPEQRYESCRTFVEQLVACGARSAGPESPPLIPAAPRRAQAAARIIASHGDVAEKRPPEAPPIESFELRSPAGSLPYRPTLFIGIGATGGNVLKRVLTRICDRIGHLGTLPAYRMLVLDTDVAYLNALGRSAPAGEEIQTVAIPLRQPEAYRAKASQYLRWLDRRWLYNVPRGLSTEGFRPFGRLAWVDHAARVTAALERGLGQVIDPSSLAATRERSGIPLDAGAPTVVLVASVSGGTGGGIVLDVAYQVRSCLKRLGLSDSDVHGVLVHSTPRSSKEHDRAIANAYATLRELNHYGRAGNFYPGEPACQVPPFHGDNRPFQTTCFVPLGEKLCASQWDAGADAIAEYLYCSTFTPLRQRQGSQCHDGSELAARMFSLRQMGGSNSPEVAEISRRICRDLVLQWRDGGRSEVSAHASDVAVPQTIVRQFAASDTCRFAFLETEAAGVVAELGIQIDRLRDEVHRMFLSEAHCADDRGYFERLLDEREQRDAAPRSTTEADLRLIDYVVGPDDEESADDQGAILPASLASRVTSRAHELGAALVRWVSGLVDRREVRVEGARAAAAALRNIVQELQAGVVNRALTHREAAASARLALAEDAPRPSRGRWPFRRDPGRELRGRLVDYAISRLESLRLMLVRKQLRIIETQVFAVIERLNVLSRSLTLLADQFRSTECPADEEPDPAQDAPVARRQSRVTLDALQHDRQVILGELEQALDAGVLAGPRKLQRFLEAADDAAETLATPLRKLAREQVLAHLGDLNTRFAEGRPRTAGDALPLELEQVVASGTEHEISPHRPRTTWIVVPEATDLGYLQGQCRGSLSDAVLLRGRTCDITVCQQSERVALPELAQGLIGGRDAFLTLSQRLQTRVDVAWDALETVETCAAFEPERPALFDVPADRPTCATAPLLQG